MGSGEWAVGSGQWGVDSGEWTVGSGQWGVGSGEWGVASGQWRVGSGEWQMMVSIVKTPLQWATTVGHCSGKMKSQLLFTLTKCFLKLMAFFGAIAEEF